MNVRRWPVILAAAGAVLAAAHLPIGAHTQPSRAAFTCAHATSAAMAVSAASAYNSLVSQVPTRAASAETKAVPGRPNISVVPGEDKPLPQRAQPKQAEPDMGADERSRAPRADDQDLTTGGLPFAAPQAASTTAVVQRQQVFSSRCH